MGALFEIGAVSRLRFLAVILTFISGIGRSKCLLKY